MSAADPVICERLDSLRSSLRSSSPLHGAAHLPADLPYVSACSFPATLLLSGIQRIITSMSRTRSLAADLHPRDDQTLVWRKGFDSHPVNSGDRVDKDRVQSPLSRRRSPPRPPLINGDAGPLNQPALCGGTNPPQQHNRKPARYHRSTRTVTTDTASSSIEVMMLRIRSA